MKTILRNNAMDKDDGFRDRAKSMNGAKRWMTHYDTVCTNSNRPVYAARRDACVEAKRHCSTRAGAVKKKSTACVFNQRPLPATDE